VLDSLLVARPIDENSPHRFGSGSEEMAATIPVLGLLLINQADVCLMHQCRGLKCLAWILLSHLLRGQLLPLVNEGQKLIGRRRITLLDG